MHWAARYVGKPWAPGAEGPHAFDCWGLCRAVFWERFGVWIPPVAEVTHRASIAGWRPAAAPAQPHDIVIVREPAGRHAGVVIETGGALAVLHANGSLRNGRPVGCVERQSLAEFLAGCTPELWRLAS